MKKLNRNLFLINVLIVAAVICVSSTVFLVHLRSEALVLAREEQEEALKTFWQLLKAKGDDFRIADGKLMAGEYIVNDDCQLPDAISGIFGGTATIFMGDARVSTNVLTPDGRRAIGTRLVGPAYDAIFRKQQPYRGEAPILGIPHFTAYDPIRDKNGQIIGVLYVGVKKSDFLAHFSRLRDEIIAGSIGLQILVSAVALLLLQKRNAYNVCLQKLAEDRQDQLNFLQVLIDTIPAPIFYKDRQGRYLGWNKSFESYLGMSREELLGRSVFEIAPPELAQRYHQMDEELFQNPGVQVYDSHVRYADGTEHDVIFNKATFSSAGGEVGGLVGVILDVTERKKAEAALAEREAFLSCVIDSIQDGIGILDEEMRIIRVNSVVERRFLGRMPLVGRKCYEAFHGRSEPCQPCPSQETLRTGVPSHKTFAATEHGREVWLEISSFPLLDAAKSRITGIIELVRDVTDAKRAEEALRESEERFYQIFAQNFDGIILFQIEDLRIIDANPKAEELTGFSANELKTLTPAYLLRGVDFARLTAGDGERKGGGVHLNEALCTRKDGSTIFVKIWSKVIILRDRAVAYCSIRDITEKKGLEEEVRSTQAKLIHANKMASLGLLASSVAHEINNPNNCISVNARILADVWRDAEPLLQRCQEQHGAFNLRGVPFEQMRSFIPQLFNGVTESSRRITTIVTNMRDCVREDKSGLFGSFDVNKAVRSASSILWHHIHTHTDSYELDLQDDLPAARGNGQQIEQVIINLVVNALQALPDRSAGVRVATRHEAEAGEVVVTVRDQGAGITPTDMKRLREPFFTTRDGGTGLGLYISAAIVKEHQGRLEFESAPGAGTTVTVRIPEQVG